jgi:hypothetical protein
MANPVIQRPISAPAMHAPLFSTNTLVDIRPVLRRRQAVVERDEMKRRTNPGNAGDDVGPPPQKHADPLDQVVFHEIPMQKENAAR